MLHTIHIGGVQSKKVGAQWALQFVPREWRAYRPYQLIGKSEDLRSEIIRLYGRKQQ